VFLVYAQRAQSPAASPDSAIGLIDGFVQEEDGHGKVVFSWSSEGAVPTQDSQRVGQDCVHLNSVATFPDEDFLISARGTSALYRIDRSTGDVLWTLGGLSSDFRFVNDP